MLDHMTAESLSAAFLLRSLTTNDHHPHLLLDCSKVEVDCIVLGLKQWGQAPLTHCRLPGPLIVPRYRRGTLLLEGLQYLNQAQQIALYDWMTYESSHGADHLDCVSRHRFVGGEGSVSRRPIFPVERRQARHPGLDEA